MTHPDRVEDYLEHIADAIQRATGSCIYSEHEAQYNIATLDVIVGSLPRRAHAMVVEWAPLHKDELMKNWERCQVPAPTVPIDPWTARGRTRTGMGLPPRDFKSLASTDFA